MSVFGDFLLVTGIVCKYYSQPVGRSHFLLTACDYLDDKKEGRLVQLFCVVLCTAVVSDYKQLIRMYRTCRCRFLLGLVPLRFMCTFAWLFGVCMLV